MNTKIRNTQTGREEARAKGHLTYYPYVTCKRGHVADRLVSNGSCIECRRQRFADSSPKLRLKESNSTTRKHISVGDPKCINQLNAAQALYDAVLKRKVSFSILFARAMALLEEHAAGLEASEEDMRRERMLIDAITQYRH